MCKVLFALHVLYRMRARGGHYRQSTKPKRIARADASITVSGEVKSLFIINALVVSRIMHRAEQVIQRHGTQPSTEPRSDRTRAEGWRFKRRSRGHRPSKEGQRPRGATVGDATFGHRPKACRPAEPGRRASSTMSSLVKQRSEVLKRRPCAKPREELRRGTSRTAAATAKT